MTQGALRAPARIAAFGDSCLSANLSRAAATSLMPSLAPRSSRSIKCQVHSGQGGRPADDQAANGICTQMGMPVDPVLMNLEKILAALLA